jgi:hypothetical protein
MEDSQHSECEYNEENKEDGEITEDMEVRECADLSHPAKRRDDNEKKESYCPYTQFRFEVSQDDLIETLSDKDNVRNHE